MNIALFKITIKQNYILTLIFTGVLLMYISIMAFMFDPEDITALTEMMNMLPEDLVKAMGFANTPSDLTGFLASFFYGFLVFAFPMVYCVILGNKLVAKTVDDGSFSYLLTTANSRSKIIITRGVYIFTSILFMFTVLFGVGTLVCESLFPGHLDIGAFLKINITAMLITMLIGMICFFFSCLYNETKNSLAVGAGIPITFFLMFMIGGVSEKAESIKKLSIFNLLNTKAIIAGEPNILPNLICIIGCVVLFVASIAVFNKKRLPI